MAEVSILKKIKLLKNFVKLTNKIQMDWKEKRLDVRGVPESFALNLLSPHQTEALHLKAKENGVSLNTWLLYNLDLASQEVLLKEHSERKWILPVNIRSKNFKLFGNHSASIILNIDSKVRTAKDLHTSIKSYFSRNLHWGSYLYSNMARFIGKRGTLKVAKNIKEVGTGVFSNLGIWPTEKIEINNSNQLFNRRAVLAPTTQILPIAATSWQWNNRLSISLQLHPSLNTEGQILEKLMKLWATKLAIEGEIELEIHHWRDFHECPKEKIIPPPSKIS
jgi:hypothetical protein